MIEKIIEKAKREHKKVYIYAHQNPDGDALSSARVLEEIFKQEGIEVQYVYISKLPQYYRRILGEIPVTTSVEKGGISIFIDTATREYLDIPATNESFFQNLSPEDTYVIDHHEKADGANYIEDQLGLPKENVIRNHHASSACEVLLKELRQDRITPEIATMLTLGLYTDTAKLKYIKPETLKNLSKLIGLLGADYAQVLDVCNRKRNLKGDVGMAKKLLEKKENTFPIGDTFGLILALNKNEVDELNIQNEVRNPQKRVAGMSDIDNCSFTCILAENTKGVCDVEFRSSSIFGNFDVIQLAAERGGGGHYNASGCTVELKGGWSTSSLKEAIIQRVQTLYSEQATGLPPISLTEQDKELATILDDTNRLTKNVTPAILARIDELVTGGAKYEYIFTKFKSLTHFKLQNEILKSVPESCLQGFQRYPYVRISLSKTQLDELINKYNVGEDEILAAIDVFAEINIGRATISLPGGRTASIDSKGNISIPDSDKNRPVPAEK